MQNILSHYIYIFIITYEINYAVLLQNDCKFIYFNVSSKFYQSE